MAAQDHRISRATDGVAIALLRRLHAGAEIPFVHHIDVCSAAPADLVANLKPAPGTDQTEDGYHSIWYFYCPKMYKNTQGKASGHRLRAIGTGETCWHPEVGAKNVHGSESGTFCSCSYGRMKDGSLERMGWSMVEYDFVDKQAAVNTAGGNYVLCKVYRPSRTKGKPSSSSKSNTSSSRKRKAGNGNPEARPAKLIHIQREHDSSFNNYYPMPGYEHQHMDHAMFGHDAVPPECDGEFVQTEYGLMPSQLANINVDEWIGCQEMFRAEGNRGLQQPSAEKEQADEFSLPTGSTLLDDDFFVGVHPECLCGVQEEVRSKASSSHAPSLSTCPVARVVHEVTDEVTIEDLFGPEMMSDEFVSMPTACTQQDASSHAPSWSTAPSSSAGCSRLVKEPPLWLPDLSDKFVAS